jgi:hypothetical protein
MAFKPSLKRKFVPGSEELDLTPIMNLVVVLIPLLLATAEFVKLGLLETRLPPASGGVAASLPTEDAAPKEKLSLIVSADSLGLGVSIFAATPASENADEHYFRLPRLITGQQDLDQLSKLLWTIRSEVVEPSILGEIQNKDAKGKLLFNLDGTPQMVDDYLYSDAENVMISAPNDLPFQELVSLMDHTRSFKSEDGVTRKLFPSPMMGKIQ